MVQRHSQKMVFKRRTFHCHVSMCEFIRRNLRFFWRGREDSSPKLRDAEGLSEVYPPLLPAEMATHRVPWAGCGGRDVMGLKGWWLSRHVTWGNLWKGGFHVESLLQGNPKDVQFIQAIIRGLSNLVFLWKSQMAHLAARSLTTKCIAKKIWANLF